MFVRVKKIGAYEYLYLVENAREGGRHVQRVVKALGRRDEVEASGMLDALVASAARHSRRSIVLSSFYGGELAELRRVSIGPDLVFGRLWRETGCAEVISALLVGRRFGFDIERAIYLTVLHRLMVSGSDRHASRWHHGFRIPGAEELTLDHAYRAMTWLGDEIADGRTTTDAIEEDLYRHRQELFGEVSIAFFDTTSLYFEGAGGQPLGQLGHSKDYRAHLKQVVLGMVLDGDDRPFASFLWPGNIADVTRLMPVVQRLRERFGIAQVCIVADRGMISAATLAALEKAGLEYILGVRERSTKEVRNEVIEDDGVAVPLTIPRQKGETQLAIKETTLKGRRYVLCRNEEEARKDADRRAAILAGLDRKLTHGDKALVSNKGFRRFVKTIGSGNFSIDYDKVEADAKFDGLFVLRTNTKLSALQVVLRYRNFGCGGHVLSAQRFPCIIEFFQQSPIDLALAGFRSDEVPEMADLGLADAVDAAEPLFEPVGIPWQVVIDHQVRALEVDAFASRVRCQQHLHLWTVSERFLRGHALFPAHAAVDANDGLGSPQQGGRALPEIVQRVAVFCKDDELLAGRGFW